MTIIEVNLFRRTPLRVGRVKRSSDMAESEAADEPASATRRNWWIAVAILVFVGVLAVAWTRRADSNGLPADLAIALSSAARCGDGREPRGETVLIKISPSGDVIATKTFMGMSAEDRRRISQEQLLRLWQALERADFRSEWRQSYQAEGDCETFTVHADGQDSTVELVWDDTAQRMPKRLSAIRNEILELAGRNDLVRRPSTR